MTVNYNDPPEPPGRSTEPRRDRASTAPATAPAIGNDDVTFDATVSDDDGDNDLTTRFIILNSAGTTVYDSSTAGTSVVPATTPPRNSPWPAPVMQALQAGGSTTEYTYHWYAMVTDNNGLTSSMPSDECYFTYNPQRPDRARP